MTTPTMALAELAEKGADVDVLREMVQFMAEQLMELQMQARCGADYDEKAPGACRSVRLRAVDLACEPERKALSLNTDPWSAAARRCLAAGPAGGQQPKDPTPASRAVTHRAPVVPRRS
ncbi:MAG: hypothetical protein HXY24_05925 [Rubrivivax sp.]|nr:hypothetical protein [Rubrivivax sp.]